MTRVLAALLAALLPSAAIAQQAAESAANEAADATFSVAMPGATVDVKVKSTLSYQRSGSNVLIAGSSTLDLSDLQHKLPAVIATLNLPHNNCQRFASDNVVASPQTSALVLANNTPTLSISGSSSVWACLENPVPETKVIWSVQQIAPGVKTKVPTVVTSAGSPLKTKLMDAQFEWSAPLVWTQSGKIQTQGATLTLKDPDQRKTQWLNVLTAPLSDQVNNMFAPLFDVNKIVPSKLVGKHPMIESVEWIDQDGHLAAKVTWEVTIPADQGSSQKNP